MRAIRTADESAVRAIRPVDQGALPTIRLATILGMLATAALLGVVSAAAGLGVAGWIAGLATGSAATALIATARMRSDQPAILPADWVTLTRAVLCAGVAGLVAASFGRPVSITALVTLSTVALVLDAVDGQVARRTGTATPLGGRLDGEVDAFLILLLSIAVSQDYGSWVLVIGAARYALLLAGWLIPWLAAPLPPRYWRKVVAAVQGIVLTVAVSGLLDRLTGMIAVAAALLLLAESFGRDVIWLYRTGAGPRTRLALRLAITVLAVVLVWGDLLAPDRAWQFTPAAFIRIPVELLVLVAVALVLPVTAATDRGRRHRNPARRAHSRQDPQHSLLRVRRSGVQPGARLGRTSARLWAWSATRSAPRAQTFCSSCSCSVSSCSWPPSPHQRSTSRLWPPGIAAPRFAASLPSQQSGGYARACHCNSSRDPRSPRPAPPAWPSRRCAPPRLRSATSVISRRLIDSPDPEASIPASDLLTGLRGKDVIIAFVESYGQVAIQGTSFSPGVDAVLRRSTASLARAGWSTQSAWVTSPSFGGISELSHSTLQSGLWVNSPERYCAARQQQPVHPQRRLRQGRLAHRERQPR